LEETRVNRLGEFSPIWATEGYFFKLQKQHKQSGFSTVKVIFALIFTKKWIGLYFGRLFHKNASGHPERNLSREEV
jgi:hypothetical protein